MCRQQVRPDSAVSTAPAPRKAWAESDSESEGSGTESDAGSSDGPDYRFSPAAPRPWMGAPKQLPSLGLGPKPISSQASRPRPQPAPLKEEAMVAAPVPPRSAAPRSHAALACYLRRENNRLRQALVQAQRQAEAAALAQPERKGSSNADLSHLLELAREFGEGPGALHAWEEQPAKVQNAWASEAEVEAEEMCIATPRTARRRLTVAAQAAELRAELEVSHQEVADLQASLACREAKLAVVRQRVSERQTPDVSPMAAAPTAVPLPQRPSGSCPGLGPLARAREPRRRSRQPQSGRQHREGEACAGTKVADAVKLAERPRSGSVSNLVARFEQKQRQIGLSCGADRPVERARSASQSKIIVPDRIRQASITDTGRNVQLPCGTRPLRRPIRRNCSTPSLVVAF